MKRLVLARLSRFMRERGRLSRRLDALFLRLHQEYENLDYDYRTNGEIGLLKKLARINGVKTIFDVGANKGYWSLVASELFPQATIHSFEIVPETSALLTANCQARRNIVCHNVGLSDTEGAISVFVPPNRSGLATCVPNLCKQLYRSKPQEVEARVVAGEEFCTRKGIDRIDFLKLDVEGYEHRVLKGFAGMLEDGRIGVIQFEYGYINIETHFLLKDFYDYLRAFGMRVGKIYPSYVDFRDYQHRDENFYGPNYLAVHPSCEEVAETLSER